jgi:hypothetical protein
LSFKHCDMAALEQASESIGLSIKNNGLEVGGIQLQFDS